MSSIQQPSTSPQHGWIVIDDKEDQHPQVDQNDEDLSIPNDVR